MFLVYLKWTREGWKEARQKESEKDGSDCSSLSLNRNKANISPSRLIHSCLRCFVVAYGSRLAHLTTPSSLRSEFSISGVALWSCMVNSVPNLFTVAIPR